ncbi:MAG: HAMP domain-containing sensor histidine kinase, partial [Aggregatilineales bacterium]
LMPLAGAGLTGLLVALLLAFLISRGIAHPLQGLARGAEAVADGKYDYTVLETGPPEIRAVAQAFNHMSGEVRASQQSQREFLASVSHDLKTPLTSIQGYSQAIVDGATPDVSGSAAIIHDEAARLNRMVLELTDLMRIQSGRFSMKLTALDVSAMADGIGQRLQMMADKKQITLHVATDTVPKIAGDGDRMAQVFNNLVSNAIKYTPNGGEVWLQIHDTQDGVEIVVRDTGEGIPEEDLSRIFERFYRVDKVGGPQRGTGLGLAISREIVAAHGGRISVHSDGRNRGSTFRIWLPAPEHADYTHL